MKGTSYNAELILQVIQGEANPFVTLESLLEVIGALHGALAKDGYQIPKRSYVGEPMGEAGSVLYYSSAIEEKAQRLFNFCAALLPDLYLAMEGDDEALKRVRPALEALEKRHQDEWEAQ